ncbi:peptidoglycan DD-metalloendopeptidase family protein (plasmid) [Rhodococcus aetherivorans]|uniref:peptidoglycan DD-metalloendopeptidase family protein n=1 Tax=Rhodococcus aetherivorans TaxID=191292 RepID=UPI0005CB7F69|nr:peptidoglycan DD-metalloendopeptidase family protein [Rhodococcus aetherivorans]
MSIRRAARALLLTGAATVVFASTSCSLNQVPVVPKDPCRTAPAHSDRMGGASESTLEPSGPIQQPTAEGTTRLTSGFGPRWGTAHRGIDLAGPVGTPIYAALDGIVVESGPASGFGNWIVIDSLVNNQPVSTVYGHMYPHGLHVREGQHVTAGEHIADIGNDGQSTGAHLHFEYWNGGRLQGGTAIDPLTKLGGALAASGPFGETASLSADSSSPVQSRLDCTGFGVAGAGDLAAGVVPPEFEPWVRKAGSLCPGIRPPLLAAQLHAENRFRHGANAPISPAGAMGPAQFMPGTWATWGKDYDGDGNSDPNSVGDAVMAQGHYLCALYDQVERSRAASQITGDPVELALAAYNAGLGAVRSYRGIPPYVETQNYIATIMAGKARYESPAAAGRLVPNGSRDGAQVVDAARQYLGTPYVWGGGGTSGPSDGGFDCSGLSSYAVHAASGGTVTLPRTSEQQWRIGTEIPLDQAEPGDLVFGSWGPNGPGHVGIYAGSGQMVHAPTTGEAVQEAPIQPGMKARRVM